MSDCSPYALCSPGGRAEAGLFELLFPSRGDPSAVRSRVNIAAPAPAVDSAEKVELSRPVNVPSPSPSDRIRAWEAAPAAAGERSRSTALESSDLIDFQDLVSSRLSQDVSYAQDDGAAISAVDAVPFPLRARELERRFREQMEVHRELTAASRHIDVVSSSVHAFRAQRRTRALLQAMTARQEAVWAHVWPEGVPVPPVTEGATYAGFAPVHGPAPHATASVTGVARAPAGGAASPVQAAASSASGARSPATASPPPPQLPASPTGSLLKDILDTFSKPREQRVAASPAAARGGAALSAASGATSTSEAVLSAPRKTVSGVEIVRPPPAPRPYPVVRYVEAKMPSSQSPPAVLRTPRHGDNAGRTRPQPTWSLSSAELLRGRSSVVEDDEVAYSQEFPDIAEDVPDGSSVNTMTEHSSGGVHTDISLSEEAYSSDTFDSDIPSEPVSDKSSAVSSVGSALTGSVGTMSGVASSASALSSSRTESVASEGSAAGSAVRARARRRHHRGRDRHGSSDASEVLGAGDAVKPLADVLHAFYEACRTVTAASTRLLKDPHLRAAHIRDTEKAETPVTSSAGTRSAAGSVRSAAAAAPSVGVPPRTPSAAVEEWGAALQRQLRRVRRLQRFRDHLLRHLERLDAQRQAQRRTTRLLQQTQALVRVREEMRSGAATRKGASLADMLKGVKGISATRAPASRFTAASEESAVEDEVLSEVLSTMSSIHSEVGSEVGSENSAITEDIASFGAGASSVVSDSIVTEEPQGWGGSTAPVSEVASASTAALDTAEDSAYASDSFEVPSEAMRSSVTVTANGLDEIEHELADRLAELSSGALSVNTSIPSDVAELVDLLPSSLIPSEVDESGVATEVATVSTAEGSGGSSVADLRARQRRLYVGVKGAAVQDGRAGVRDGADYLRDSPGSSVYSVPEDADVDATTGPSSAATTADSSAAHAASTGPARADAGSAEGTVEAAPTTADVTATARQAGERDSATSSYATSSSDDVLTALEADMALTKGRRRRALGTATAAPTFTQLYDPTVRPAPDASPSDTAGSTSRESDSSGLSEGGNSAGGRQVPAAAPAVGSVGGARVLPSGAQLSEHARRDGTAASPAAAALSRVEAGTQADPPTTAASAADAPTEGLTRSAARVYPAEDYVAQRAWKARQLHLLRQLRTPTVEVAGRASATHLDDDGDVSTAVGRPTARSSVDVALDAAEAAAREEWAQHWGVVESLLHTRFANAATTPALRAPPPRREPRAVRRADVHDSLSSTSSPPYSRDASQSTVATAASATSVGGAR